MIAIGIDPGVNTGFAIWSTDRFALVRVESMSIIRAMGEVQLYAESRLELDSALQRDHEFIVIVEDARKRKWSGGFREIDENTEKYGAAAREGVGSVKRDCSIWEEFLTEHQIPHEMRFPRATKMLAAPFKRLTLWPERTNQHARDAAMIVFQLNKPMLRLKLETFQQQRGSSRESSLPPNARWSNRGGRRR